MSKQVKQMQMDALKHTFGGVRDLVVLSINGLNAVADNHFRHTLRKKKIRLMQVKNSLARLTLNDLGISIDKDSPYWAGSTTFAFGAGSIAELSRGIEDELKNPKTLAQYKDKVKVKGAVADGLPVPFDRALKMPTRQEAIANVIAMALAPASRLLGQITGPAAAVASQIKQLGEKKEEEAPAAAETAAPAAT